MTNCRLGGRPRNDAGYLEEMAKVIFRVGFNRDVIERKWPAFREAFAGFSVEAVAAFGLSDRRRLLADRGIVRNERKIAAVIENARVFARIRKEHGSFSRYLDRMEKAGEETMCESMRKTFAFLGGASTLFFLRSVGRKMPETTRAYEASSL